MTEMKIKVPYPELSETLKKALSLTGCCKAREEQGRGASRNP